MNNNINTSVQNEATQNEKEVLKLKVNPPAVFDSTAEVVISRSDELSKLINGLFGKVFADYHGCSMKCVPSQDNGGMILTPVLYFNILPDAKYNDGSTTAFRTLSSVAKDPNENLVSAIVKKGRSLNTNYKYEITDDGKSVLEDFLMNVKRENYPKYDWTKAHRLEYRNTGTLIQVFNMDLAKIVRTMYGPKDSNGSSLYYEVYPTYTITNQQYKTAAIWALNILRLNGENQRKAAELLGWGPMAQDSGNYIVTDVPR